MKQNSGINCFLRFNFRLFLTLWAICFCIGYSVAAPVIDRPDSVRRAALDEFLASSGVPKGSCAILIRDLHSGSPIVEYASSRPLIPASIMKCVTTASLLKKKGPHWQYSTRVLRDGKIRNRVLNGNLIIEGSGDPSVNTSHEPHTPDFVREIVDALKELDIDSIAGKIIVDNDAFSGTSTPPSWGSGDRSCAYGTGSHAFNFRDNRSGSRSVADPSEVFRNAMISALRDAGIAYGANSLKEGHRSEIFTHKSAPLEDIMRSCMMRSDNLFAECLLRSLSLVSDEDGSTVSAAEIETGYWKKHGADMENVRIIDGSGLSRTNRVTANFMTDVLTSMKNNVEYASFFPLAGQEGTLRKFMKDTRLDSYLAMKTGSMSGIQCYAGYLLDEDFAPTHTVVVIANDMPDRAKLRAALTRFFLTVF